MFFRINIFYLSEITKSTEDKAKLQKSLWSIRNYKNATKGKLIMGE